MKIAVILIRRDTQPVVAMVCIPQVEERLMVTSQDVVATRLHDCMATSGRRMTGKHTKAQVQGFGWRFSLEYIGVI